MRRERSNEDRREYILELSSAGRRARAASRSCGAAGRRGSWPPSTSVISGTSTGSRVRSWRRSRPTGADGEMEGVLSQQHLIPSGFGAKTTAREAIGNRRLDGKTAIVTGGYAASASRPRACSPPRGTGDRARARSREGQEGNRRARERQHRAHGILAAPPTIDAFVQRFGDRPLHLLINNAGIMRRRSRGMRVAGVASRGEPRWPLSALHTARTRAAARRARGVIALSSRGHVRSAFDFDDPDFERRPVREDGRVRSVEDRERAVRR